MAKLRLLILEDSPDDAELMVAQLRAARLDPEWSRVESESDFLANLERGYDIILADYNLPYFNGLRALELARAHGGDIPFILISGTIGEDVAVEAMRQGAADYILKDRMARLASAVHHAREERRLRDENRQAQQALENERQRWYAILEGLPVIVVLLTPDYHVPFANRFFRERFSEPQGRRCFEFIVGRKKPCDNCQSFNVLRTGVPGRWEWTDPNLRSYDVFDFPFTDTDGSKLVLEMCIDITERKRTALQQGLMYEVLRAVSTQLDILGVARSAAETIVRLTGYPHVCIAFPDKDGEHWVVQGAAGRLAAELGAVYSMDQGVIGRAFKTGQMQWVGDILDDPEYVRDVRVADASVLRSEIVALIRSGNELLGALNIESERVNAFDENDAMMVQSLADMIALALKNARLFDLATLNARRMQALHKVDLAISGSFDQRIMLDSVLKQVIAELHVDAASILIGEPYAKMLVYFAGIGFRTHGIEKSRLRLGEGYAGRAALEQKTTRIEDFRQCGDRFTRAQLLAGENFVSYFGVPLVAKAETMGLLEIFHRSRLAPDGEWFEFMHALAGQAAIALDSASLFDNLQRSSTELVFAYDNAIEGWAHSLELHTKESEGHAQRVAEMTLRLARSMGLDEAQLVHTRRGALLHDIGTLGVPDAILFKPGPLTDDEWVTMRKHPVIAYDLLSPNRFLSQALDIPYCHHEKWDGTGYPRGLSGEQIPLSARAFAVIDVLDALRSDRPYRIKWPEDRALEYVRSQSGTHFDPRVVNAFFNIKEELDQFPSR